MTVTLDLDKEMEVEIELEAARLQITPSEYVKRVLQRTKRRSRKKTPANLYEELVSILGEPDLSGEGTSKWSTVEAACDP